MRRRGKVLIGGGNAGGTAGKVEEEISTEKNLEGTTDSILIRKSRLRRIISGGKLPSSRGEQEGKGHVDTEAGQGDGKKEEKMATYASPVSTWNLNEECLLDAFLTLYDEVEQHRNKDTYGHFFLNKFQPVVTEVKQMRVNLSDFRIGKVIGKGTFATIHLVKEKSNGRRFAMKSYDKSNPQVKESLHLLDAELGILSKNTSQWIVGFNYAFHDQRQVHLIMEFMSGGTFRSLLDRHGGRLDQDVVKFYLGEMILAINVVHSLGFAHRKLTPENILLDSLGHLKLAGFGCASKISKNGKVTSPLTVDEASYEAPEILQTLGNDVFTYGVECDYWSLGAIAFESVFGEHPFLNSASLTTFRKITTPRTKENPIEFPACDSPVLSELLDLIRGLLVQQAERLGYEDCIRHPFFNTLIWDGIRNEVALSIPPLAVIDDAEFSREIGPESSAGKAFRPLSNVAFVGFTKIQAEDVNQTSLLEASLDDSSILSVDPWKTSTADTRLKSELELKTESLKEKLNEIQMLQMQLQKYCATIESKDTELAKCKGENKRLELELEQANGKLMEEKDFKEQLEFRLQEKNVTANVSDMIELKEEINRLTQILDEKDQLLSELGAEVQNLRLDVKTFKNEKRTLLKRENEMEESFVKSYRGSISMMESRVTRNSATQEARIKELESKLLEERTQRNEELKQREEKMKDLILKKSEELSEVQGRMEEARLSRETCLEEARQQRKKYGETIGQLQEALEKALEEYSEIKERFEREHDPEMRNKIEELQKLCEDLSRKNSSLEAQLDECEKGKQAEIMKAQEMHDLVQRLGESVQSLQQQKADIFESTREFLRQSQDSEALKGAQKVLEEQLCKAHENLDAAKQQLYEEKQKYAQLSTTLEAAKKESDDVRKVVRLLTESKQEVEDELKKQEEGLKIAGATITSMDGEMKELKKSNGRQAKLVQELEEKVTACERDIESTLDLLQETKTAKERLEMEVVNLKAELQASKLELEGMEQLKLSVGDLEIRIKEKECQVEEKVRELEDAKMKTELLKETCEVLENQLKRLEALVGKKEEELQASLQTSSELTEKLTLLDGAIKEARRDGNEAKSQQIYAEKQLAAIKSQKEKEDKSKSTLIAQLNDKNEEMRKKYDDKLTELNGVLGQLEQLKQEKSIMEMQTEDLRAKQDRFSKEISRYLDSIVRMKEQIMNYKTDLHEASQKAEFYRERATILMEEKELVELDANQREIELQSTITQQAKLVQFFQNQAQLLSSKRKKFRFFSREKETELPRPPSELLKCATLPATSYVPRTPVSASKTPQRILMEPKKVPKFQFDDDFSDDDEQGTAGDTSSLATSDS